jgi:hypothetical protein
MDQCQIARILAAKQKGTFFTVRMVRPAKLRAAFKLLDIRKESSFQGMTGVDYAMRAPVRSAVESGERCAPELPSWVERVEHIEGIKFWVKGAQWYFPMVFIKSLNAQWWSDDQPVELSIIRDMLLASEYAERATKTEVEELHQAQFNAIKVENILELH